MRLMSSVSRCSALLKNRSGCAPLRREARVVERRLHPHGGRAEVADARLERHAHAHVADLQVLVLAEQPRERLPERRLLQRMREADRPRRIRARPREHRPRCLDEALPHAAEQRDERLLAIRRREDARLRHAHDDHRHARRLLSAARLDERLPRLLELRQIVEPRVAVTLNDPLQPRLHAMGAARVAEEADGAHGDGRQEDHDHLLRRPRRQPNSRRRCPKRATRQKTENAQPQKKPSPITPTPTHQ
jgi:hypothetical protein